MSPRKITHNGVTLTIRDWAKRTNQTPFTLRYRLDAGWPTDEALFTPLNKPGRTITKRVQHARRASRLEANAAHIRQDFKRLAREIDRALTVFDQRIKWLLNETEMQHRGVGMHFAENISDQGLPLPLKSE